MDVSAASSASGGRVGFNQGCSGAGGCDGGSVREQRARAGVCLRGPVRSRSARMGRRGAQRDGDRINELKVHGRSRQGPGMAGIGNRFPRAGERQEERMLDMETMDRRQLGEGQDLGV